MKKVLTFLKKDLSIVIIAAVLSIIIWIPTSFLGFDNRIYMMFASWIGTISLLICGRKITHYWGYFILFFAILFSSTLTNYGLYGTGAIELLPNLICAVIIFPAFFLDSFLHRKYNKFYFTLVFPAAYTVLSIIISLLHIGVCFRFEMFSSVLTVPYQIVSIIGSYGLTFLIAWILCCVLYIAKNIKDLPKLKIATICPAVMAGVLIFGCARYFSAPKANFTFKIAYAAGPYRGDFIDSEDVSFEENVAYFISSCDVAAEKGASLVAYTEEAFCFKGSEEEGFLTVVKAKAVENNISILLGLEVELNKDTSQNKILWIDSNGEIKANYLKSHLIPLLESSDYEKGDNIIPYIDFTVDEHKVRISTCICYDSDDPLYTYSMNRDTDVFIVPCWDWKLIQEKHTNSTAYIPLQNHVTFVKLTYDGWTSVTDPYGRKTYNEKTEETDIDVHIIDVPVFK